MSARCELGTWIMHVDRCRAGAEARWPSSIGTADQQCAIEPSPLQGNPLEAICERALVEEQLRADLGGTIAAQRARMHVEETGHASACAPAPSKRQGAMGFAMLYGETRSALELRVRDKPAIGRNGGPLPKPSWSAARGGETFAVDALGPMPKYRQKDRL